MANKDSSKNDFILDCCNKATSKMTKYESSKDIYLAGYFALKRKRNTQKTSKIRKDSQESSKKNYGPSVYLITPRTIKETYTSGSLPSVKKSKINPISSEEFKQVLNKYRQL